VEVATGAVTTLVGSGEEGDADGVGDAAQFKNPMGAVISPDGSALFVTDYGNHKILKEGAAPSLKARDAPPRHTPLPAQCSPRLPSRAVAHGGQ